MEPIIGQKPQGGDIIKESDSRNFKKDVIDPSSGVPVVVDFWAPWCQPCKQLGPILEKLVRAAHGKVKLVKVNIDENPDLAQMLRVQSIPAVFAFSGGQPVNGFTGALPESQLQSFINSLTSKAPASPIEQALEQAATALEGGNHGAASTLYQQILQHEPDNIAAAAGLARCHIAANKLDRAKQVLESIGNPKAPEATSARAALALAEQSAKIADAHSLEAKLAEDPDNHQARLDLAMAHYASGSLDAAVEQLLELFRRDREWNDQAARVQLLRLFEAFGPTNSLTVNGRKRLSALMFT